MANLHRCLCSPTADHGFIAEALGADCVAAVNLLDIAPNEDGYDRLARLARISAEGAAHAALHIMRDVWTAGDLSDAIVFIQTHYSRHVGELTDQGFMTLVRAANHLDARLERVLEA